MAIVKKAGPSSLPLTSADYVAQNLQQTHDKLNLEQPIRISGSNVLQGALFQIGETYYYAESATAITGTPSDYVKITPSVDTLTATASFVASLTGVTWNASFGGYYDSSGNLYVFDEAKALQATAISTIMTRYVQQSSAGDVVIGRNISVAGQVTGSLDIETDLTVGNDLDVGTDLTVGNDLAVIGSTGLGNGAADSTTIIGDLIIDTENAGEVNVYAREYPAATTQDTVHDWVSSILGGGESGALGYFGGSYINSITDNGSGSVSVAASGSTVKSFTNGNTSAIGSTLKILFIQ